MLTASRIGVALVIIGATIAFILGLIAIWAPAIQDQLGNTALMFVVLAVVGFFTWVVDG